MKTRKQRELASAYNAQWFKCKKWFCERAIEKKSRKAIINCLISEEKQLASVIETAHIWLFDLLLASFRDSMKSQTKQCQSANLLILLKIFIEEHSISHPGHYK